MQRAARSCPGDLIEDGDGRLLCEFGSACRVDHLRSAPRHWMRAHRDVTVEAEVGDGLIETMLELRFTPDAARPVRDAAREGPPVSAERLVQVLIDPPRPPRGGHEVFPEWVEGFEVLAEVVAEARHRVAPSELVDLNTVTATVFDHVVLRGASVAPALLYALANRVLGERAPSSEDELALLLGVCREFGTRPSDLEA